MSSERLKGSAAVKTTTSQDALPYRTEWQEAASTVSIAVEGPSSGIMCHLEQAAWS